MPEMMTIEAVQRFLRVRSYASIWKMVDKGDLPKPFRSGGVIRVDREAVLAAVAVN